MLQVNSRWLFDSPGQIDPPVAARFEKLINHIAGLGHRKGILETFKTTFSAAAGVQYGASSDANWAASDLSRVMNMACENAPLFIKAFYDGCAILKDDSPNISVPDIDQLNRILDEAEVGFRIDYPNVVAASSYKAIDVPAHSPSLDEQGKELVKKALEDSEKALADGNGRQAVQEVLWLLETFSTAFRGEGDDNATIQGRYFNQIIKELRTIKHIHKDQILAWMMTLHGYLSSPTGGGVRHGVDLKNGLALEIEEARLYCNLTRSYLNYLISVHERLKG